MLARGIAGQRQRRQGVAARSRRCARSARACHVGHDAAHVARRRHRRGLDRRARRTTPRSSRRRARGLRLLPRSAALDVGDAAAGGWSPSPAPTARPRPPRCSPSRCSAAGADPSYAIGGDLDETGSNAARRQRRPVRRRGRRERRRVPGLLAARRPRHQRRGRPPRQLRHRGGLPRRLRRRSSTGSTPTGFLVVLRRRPGRRRARPHGRASAGCAVVARRGVRRTPTCAPTDLRVRRRRRRAFTVVDARPPSSARSRCRSPGRHYVLDALAALAVRPAARLRLRRPAPRARGVHRHPAPDGAQGRGRRRPGLRQLRPPPQRDRRRPAGRPRRWRARAGWSWPSSRTWSRAPGSSAPTMGVALGAADEVVVMDVYVAREDAEPGVTGALVADAVPLPPEQVAFVPVLAAAPADAGRAGPARRPGAHPRRRRRDRARPAVLELLASGADALTRRATDRSRRRFARRQWAAPLARPGATLAGRRCWCSLAAGRRRSVYGWSSSPPLLAVRGRRGHRHPDAQRATQVARGGRRTRPASRWPGSTSTRSRSGSRSLAVVEVRRGHPRSGRTTCCIEVVEREPVAVVDIGGQLRSLDAEGVVFGSYAARPTELPLVRADVGRRTPRRSPRRPRWSSRAARPTSPPGRLRRGAQRRPDHAACCATGATVLWGSADGVRREGRGARRAARGRPRRERYDVSVPGMPTTSR